ncbi:MAG: phage tail protein [Bacteroidota bacterium]
MKIFKGILVFVIAIGFVCTTQEAVAQPFTVNPHRVDPYKQFKFRVKWDGRYIPGITSVSGLHRKTQAIEFRTGGDANNIRKSPGPTSYSQIILTRGLTHDTSFEEWADYVSSVSKGLGDEIALARFRKDIVIELYNEAGQLVMAYQVYRCWPSEYEAFDNLNSRGRGEIVEETLVLETEGWIRDREVREPLEH